MASKVQICNRALIRVGSTLRVTDIDTPTTQIETICNTLFTDVLDDVLVDNDWRCATFKTTLNRTINTPSYKYLYEFQLPVDPYYLKVISIDECFTGDTQYEISGDKLLTNETAVKITYIGRLTNPAIFNTMLKRVLIAKLAYELTFALSASTVHTEKMYELYLKELAECGALDGQQGSVNQIIINELTQNR